MDPADDGNALKHRRKNMLKNWLSLHTTNSECDSNILWLHSNPGTRKSTMTIMMTKKILNLPMFVSGDNTLAYFFSDSTYKEQRTATAILCGRFYQLVKQRPGLMRFMGSK
jgi:hypothetical protein